MNLRNRTVLVFNLFVFGITPAIGDDRFNESDYAKVNIALVKSHVLPRYFQLAIATDELEDAVNSFCSAPDAEAFVLMKARFHHAMDAWMGVQHIDFGPIELFMRVHRFYFWPQARGKVSDAVRELVSETSQGELTAARISQSNVAIQGLLAVETMLYRDYVLLENPQGCSLLGAIAVNMQDMAGNVVAEWQGGNVAFTDAIEQPGPENIFFEYHREVMVAFFRSFHKSLQLVAELKVKPVVADSLESVKPYAAESRLSGRSLVNVIVNLKALEAMYVGEGEAGLGDLVRTVDPELDQLLRKAFRLTIENAESINKPLEGAAVDAGLRPKAEKLLLQAKALRQIVRRKMAPALGVAVGFNSFDGD